MNPSFLSALFSLRAALQSASSIFVNTSHQPQPLDGWSLTGRDPAVLTDMMPLMKWFYDIYYRVSSDGWEQVPADEPVMFIGSHNGGLPAPDMHMMLYDWCRHFGTEKPLYGLMSPKVWNVFPPAARVAARMGAVQEHPIMGIAALNLKASIAVFPGGIQDVFRPYSQRHKIYFHNRKGFIKLAIKKGVPIVPMISYGAHSTFMVLADIYPQMRALHEIGMPWALGIDPEAFPIYLGLPWGLAVGPLPHIPPPIKIHTRIRPPIYFDRTGAQAMRDSDYVDLCFRRVKNEMQQSLDRLVAEIES